MQYNFLNIFLNSKDLLAQSKVPIDPFLLENSAPQIEKIYDFYKSNKSLLFVNGFMGTGKTRIVDYTRAFLSQETIVLKYNCYNATILDDILLSFFADFKNLAAQNIISSPKIRTENFTQKINAYFSQIEKPFVLMINSFEEILDENRQEVLDFILHLSSNPKIKIIIIGKSYERSYFKDLPIERVTIFPLSIQLVEKYFKNQKIKYSNLLLEEYYKHARGYFFFIKLSANLIKNDTNLLFDFLTKLKNSFLPLFNFLEKQAIATVPASERNLFWFLTLIRHPVSIDLLKKLQFYDEEKLQLLLDNLVLLKEGHLISIREFIREPAENAIAPHIAQKIRQYIIDLYQTQLPLKPFERDICISRQTMRKEIEYHSFFLPKRPQSVENVPIDINFLSYSQANDFGAKEGNKEKPKTTPQTIKKDENFVYKKNANLNLENIGAKQAQAPNISDIEQEKINVQKAEKFASEYAHLSLSDLIEKITQAESNFMYQVVIDLCKIAILKEKDIDYKKYSPIIYEKLANAYEQIANHEQAIIFYSLAQEIYEETNNECQTNLMKFNQANALYESYKIDDAKKIFEEITITPQCNQELLLKALIRLADIADSNQNSDKAFEYYNEAINKSDISMDKKLLSELYFKYALTLDDKNDIRQAIAYYEKCIETSESPQVNKFLSSTYSNIAMLYQEKKDTQNAIKNYKKAFDIDKQSNNVEGMYYSSTKLAGILQKENPPEALKQFEKALNYAKLIKDVFYIVSAALAIGDFYYDKKQNELALKYYFYSENLAKSSFSKENLKKIEVRINDIKFRLGTEKFEEVIEILKAQDNE